VQEECYSPNTLPTIVRGQISVLQLDNPPLRAIGHPLNPPPGDVLGNSFGWALGSVTSTLYTLYKPYSID